MEKAKFVAAAIVLGAIGFAYLEWLEERDAEVLAVMNRCHTDNRAEFVDCVRSMGLSK